MVTLTDVARTANVARSVASRVLNGDQTLRVTPATAERVLRAARELRYTPNASARALRLSKTGALGLIVHDITNPLYGEIVRGVQCAAVKEDFAVLLAEFDDFDGRRPGLRNLVSGGRVDGLLIQHPRRAHIVEMVARLGDRVPMVLINDRGDATVSSVALDDVHAARVATAHLLELGHKRIAYLGGNPSGRDDARKLGWTQALKDAGVTPSARWAVRGGWDVAAGRAGMAKLLNPVICPVRSWPPMPSQPSGRWN